MKVLQVRGLLLQFDANEGEPLALTQQMVDEINVVLNERFPDAQPQLFMSGIDGSDIDELEN